MESWGWFGPPCTVSGGMAVAIDDKRDRLYLARREVLRDAGVPAESREIYFRLWGALDRAQIEVEGDRVSKAMSK
jgi:hypothetical protein